MPRNNHPHVDNEGIYLNADRYMRQFEVVKWMGCTWLVEGWSSDWPSNPAIGPKHLSKLQD